MRLCETQSGAPVSLRDLAVAALIGQVQRIITDPAGHTIDLGRKSRLFVGSARDAVLLAGDPVDGIVKLADEKKADLIAMSTHGHRFLGDLIHGSTASRVRHTVRIPDLLLRA